MIGIEVFAGAGGMSHGAEAAGGNVRAAIEICPSSYKVGRQSGLSIGGSGSFV